MKTTDDIEKRTLTITRTFDVPRALAWDAWTQPEHIAKWWGPKGMKVSIRKHDFREGGEWEYSMPMPNGQEFMSFGKYSRIVKPELIETSANFVPMTEGVTIVATFADKGDKTDFVFKVIHPTEAYCKQQEDMGFFNGWGSVFEGLSKYLLTLV
ncbi:MAG: SRPBCC domain-containing protein [Cyclobacteriaceae bacterium]|nr:SRPBCC domain-containing protein [Cyclobacteriaceae bacterium]